MSGYLVGTCAFRRVVLNGLRAGLTLAGWRVLLAACFCALLALPDWAQAQATDEVLVSNTAGAATAAGISVGALSGGGTGLAAQRFTAGSNTTGYMITQVSINVASVSSGPAPVPMLRICPSDGSNPDTTNCTALTLSGRFGVGEVVFDAPAGGIAVDRFQSYFLVAGAAAGNYQLSQTASGDQTGAPGWDMIDRLRISANNGADWSNDDDPLRIAIRGTINPPELGISTFVTEVAEGDTISLGLSRTGDTGAALTVTVEIDESLGDAFPATDTATFAAGTATAVLELATDGDTAGTTTNIVTATIAASLDGAYVLDPDATSVSVTVFDPDAGICGRTPAVRDALLARLTADGTLAAGATCADVTDANLAAITATLELSGPGRSFTALRAGDFAGLVQVSELVISGNTFLTALPTGAFAGLDALTTLELSSNGLSPDFAPGGVPLPADVFAGLTSLEALDLSNNLLETLPAGVFAGLATLTTLELNANALETLPADVFAGLEALTALDLSDNVLRRLDAGVLADLAALTELDVSGNQISTLAEGVVAGPTALRVLNLSDNRLVVDLDRAFLAAPALEQLNLSRNSIVTLADGAFAALTALTTLNLSRNSIATLPDGAFAALTALTTLDLSRNSIATFPDGAFAALTALTTLDLSRNSIATLPDGVFAALTALTNLRLSRNSGAPFAPTADALPDDGTVATAGGDVALTGSDSGGAWGDNVTYGWALTDPASGTIFDAVTFDDAAGVAPVVTIPALDADTALTFTLTVTGRGGTNGIAAATDTATVTATAPTTNADPVFTDTAPVTRSFDENEGDATKSSPSDIGLPVAATDADNDTLTYELDPAGRNNFAITATGQITTISGVNYDHETTPSYAVTVTVTDGNGGSATIAVTIDVNDVAELPFRAQTPTVSATAGSTMSLDVSWNSSNNTGRPAITYDLQYRPGTTVAFTPGPQGVDMRSAVITGLAPDTQYQVQVRATNADGDGDWSASGSGTTAPPPGEVLVSNTAETVHSDAQTVGNSFPGLTAQGFTTGSEAHGYELNSVGIHVTEDNRSAGEIFTVEIYRFDNADPIYKLGALVHTLTTPGTIIEGAVNNFAAPAGATLLPDTRYLITFTGDGDSNGDFTIARTFSDAQTGVAGWLIDNNFLSAGLSTTISLLINVRGAVRSDAGNTTATGAPAITGMAQVGGTLTATSDTIADADGLTSPGYAYQWQRVDSDGTSNPEDIADATAASYAVTSADAGRRLRVAVSFRDDAGYAEGPLFSPATATVECESGVLWCATLTVQSVGGGDRGCANNHASNKCSNSARLSDDTFTYDTTDYDIRQLRLQSGGQLRLILAPDITAGSQSLILHVGDAEFAFAAADTPLVADRREWSSSGLSWSNGDSVEVKLTEAPPSADATLSALTLADASDGTAIDLSPTFAAGTTAYTVAVGNAVTSVTLSATATDTAAATVAITGDSDTTTPGEATFSLSEGANNLTVTVTAADDNTTQTYTVTVTRASPPEVMIAAAAPTVFYPTSDFAGEPEYAVTWTVTRTGATTDDLDVTVNLTQDKPYLDTAQRSQTVTIPAGDASADLTFTGTQLQLPASEVLANGTLTATVTAGTGYEVGADASASVDIVVFMTVRIEEPEYTVAESAGTVDVTIVARTGDGAAQPTAAELGPQDALFVVLTTEGGTATPGADFESDSHAPFFVPGDFMQVGAAWQAERVIPVTILDDTLAEPDEVFPVSLVDPGHIETLLLATPAGLSSTGMDQSQITILDDEASGVPTITGTAQVDETLTADVSGIMDADGLTSPGYTWQWLRVDGTDGTETNISGATSATYTLVDDDAGNAVRVTVSFTDDAANPETLTSAVYPSSGAIAAATPEIAVLGLNDTEITSGANRPLDLDGTNFGAVGLLDETGANAFVERTFTVKNTGTGPLTLGPDAVSLVDPMTGRPGVFSVQTQPAETVAAGGMTTFVIRFDPASTGGHSIYVELANDDDDESPFRFRIGGNGVTPQLSLSGPDGDLLSGDRTVSFGVVAVASGMSDVTFTVANTGTGVTSGPLYLGPDAVSLGGDAAADYRVVTQPDEEVVAGASTTFTLRFDPTVAGLRQATATLNVINDLTFRPAVEFALQGGEVLAEITIASDGDVDEGDAALFTLTRTGDAAAELMVSVSVSETGDTVAAGDEGAQTVTFEAGSSTATLSVATEDDTVDEANSVVTVSLVADTTDPAAYILGGLASADATVTNDDTDTSTDATLSGLTLADASDGTAIDLSPTFAAGTTAYTVAVANAVTALTLTATVNDAGAAVSAVTLGGTAIADTDFSDGIEVPSLILGDNAIVLTVTAADDSTTQTYAVTVTRTVPSLTGAPTISGTAQVGETLTADVSGIMDADGLTSPGYTWQWIRVDGDTGTETNISGATSASYTLVGDDAGNAVRVRVNFTDDAANPETLTSAVYPLNGTIAPAMGGAPEIAVQGNGEDISSGDERPGTQDHTNFGFVSLLDATGQNEFAERTFTILNTGDGILTLGTDAVSLVVAPPGITSPGMPGSLLLFSVTEQPAATVAPGGETTFTIRFDPLGAGAENLYVSLANDDANENPVPVPHRRHRCRAAARAELAGRGHAG